MTRVAARPASTVVMVRPSSTRFDVFLVRRHDAMTFMGGAHVFPGGRVDPQDRLEQPRVICDGVDEIAARMPELDPADAVAYYVAAVRELFEEAATLLARDEAGTSVAMDDAGLAARKGPPRWKQHRSALSAGRTTLAEVVMQEGVRLALDALTPFSRWITPEAEAKRFDVRFFLATLPTGQEPSHDEDEMSEGGWFDPSEAIRQCRADAIALPPPTWTTLRTLERFSTIEEVVRWARERELVGIQPRISDRDGIRTLTLPGDPLHEALPGFDTPSETRFALDGKRWRPI